MKLRVVVADDSAEFARALVSILEVEFDVVETASDGKAALECIRRCRPDVVVLDLHIRVLDVIAVTRELSRHTPSPPVVICSIETDAEFIEAARKAGALGYVFKHQAARDLVLAVTTAARGQCFLPSINGG
jgi:DNA-binding NarL/FixJ family response regulator